MTAPALAVDALEVRYGGVAAVRGLTMEVGEGEIVGLIGPNGAGKSTTLHAIMGAIAPASGDVRLRGASLVGRVPEDVARAGRWEDFETYYSCAPWGAPEMLGRRIDRNGVYKQNTLSIAWCAEAFLSAWRVTRDERWLRLSRRCIDELSLYQAVWILPGCPRLRTAGSAS